VRADLQNRGRMWPTLAALTCWLSLAAYLLCSQALHRAVREALRLAGRL